MFPSKELLSVSLKYLNGFLPIYKPKNICINNVRRVLTWDIYFILNLREIQHGTISCDYARFLEPFADGVVTFAIGNHVTRKKNFAFANTRYKAVIEFGAEREYHCIDGDVLSTAKIDNLSRENITEKLRNFVGDIQQKRLPCYHQQHQSSSYEVKTVEQYYRQIEFIKGKEIPKSRQKYPYSSPNRQMNVENIELVNYIAPFAELEISCHGCFSPRQFTADLASQLNTVASLVELSRIKEGPILLGDLRILQLEELNLEYWLDRFMSLKTLYEEFNDEMDPIWEKINT